MLDGLPHVQRGTHVWLVHVRAFAGAVALLLGTLLANRSARCAPIVVHADTRRLVMSMKAMLSALVLCHALFASRLSAGCPRTSGEHARRILPGFVYFPLGFLVLACGQSRVPMPAVGARVRVSHEVPEGLRFMEGAFLATTDSAFYLLTGERDTLAFPLATTRCLQVYRRSRWNGAGGGFVAGIVSGLVIGGVIGAGAGEAAGGATSGSIAGAVVGPLIGAKRGAAAWYLAWERRR